MNPAAIEFQRIDVRKILAKGLEPLPAIRSRVETLKSGHGLVVLAPFLPSPLIELLRSEGFESRVEPAGGNDWVVYFWRSSADC